MSMKEEKNLTEGTILTSDSLSGGCFSSGKYI
jgi:hypothetical protein